MLNGICSRTFDFDDTRLRTIVHPAGRSRPRHSRWPRNAAPAARQLVEAVVLGIDVACHIGDAVYPDQYERGWHLTAGPAARYSRGQCADDRLDVQRTTMALGIAASRPIGCANSSGR